jgi:hypothetical protein
MLKEGDLLLHAHPGHIGMWWRNHWDHRRMFAAIFAMRVPPFRMFGHLFMDAKPAIAWGADFINSKHHTHEQRCFGIASFIQTLWICPFGWLQCFCDCTCTLQDSRGESHAPEINYACHQRIPSHISATVSSSRPVGGSPWIENIAYDSDIILENSRQQTIGCDRLGFPASWNQHNGTLNDANQHALILFSCHAAAWIWVCFF